MQLFIFVRGEVRAHQRFIEELSAKYLPFVYKGVDKDGKFIEGTQVDYHYQVTVRTSPLGIYEVCFPEPCLDMMLETLFRNSNTMNGNGNTWRKTDQKYVKMFRFLLGIDKIPKTWNKEKYLPLTKDNLEIIAIGMKRDTRDAMGNENV